MKTARLRAVFFWFAAAQAWFQSTTRQIVASADGLLLPDGKHAANLLVAEWTAT
jgi:hypothetical protein